jgi:polyisoprenoid-binding protein YceI
LDENNLKSGAFTIDMKSMSITDLKGSSAQNLLGHLRGEDFFAIEKHPASTFVITKVSQSSPDKANITGNLTIKGITNTISFPANLKKQKNGLTAFAKDVKVDRTKYDIRYRSKSFFGDIGDKAIDDEFSLNINLVCKK